MPFTRPKPGREPAAPTQAARPEPEEPLAPAPPPPSRVALVASDTNPIRSAVLETFWVVAEARTSDGAMRSLEGLHNRQGVVLLLDLQLAGEDVPSLLRRVRAAHPVLRVLAFGEPRAAEVERVLLAGADSVVAVREGEAYHVREGRAFVKEEFLQQLRDAVARTARNEHVFVGLETVPLPEVERPAAP
ncbi:MAG TPA: hypothetical protein VNO34_08760, partial [Actinomycetota bacterium]|nr:hypothetical protein [Actinomycetota bacterium]